MAHTNIKARRLLSDMFLEGVEIRFRKVNGKPEGKVGPFVDKDGIKIPAQPDDVCMFIRPPDPLQRDMAMRAGQARRARALVRAKRDEDSEEHLTALAFLADMERETLIDYILMGDTGVRRADAEREVLAQDEWKDITAYQDAMRQFADMDAEDLVDNEEWQAMIELDEKFIAQVNLRERQLQDTQRDILRMLDRKAMERKAIEKRSEIIGNQAFLQEYERQMKFYSCREVDDPGKLFFERAEELAAYPQPVQDLINDALLPYITEVDEAKNSQRAASGSDSAELPSEPVTIEASTREEQTA